MNDGETEVNGHAVKNKDVPEVAAAIAEGDASPPPAAETPAPDRRQVMRYSLFKVDSDWPPDGVNHFDVEVPQPAIFSKAYAMRAPTVGLDGKQQMRFRAVFVVCPDAPMAPVRLLTMSEHAAIGVVRGMPSPTYLETVVHPMTGSPVGLWRIPHVDEAGDAVEEPTDGVAVDDGERDEVVDEELAPGE